MSKRLLIVGAGGHGKVIADTATTIGTWAEISFIDDNQHHQVCGYPVLTDLSNAAAYLDRYQDIIIGIGNNERRLQLIQQFKTLGFNIPSLFHPEAYISKKSENKEGSVVFAKAVININAHVDMGCIINSGAIVEHDCHLEQGVHLSPNAALAGGVTIGEKSWIGMGTNVIENVTIGKEVIVGAGAVVINDIPDYAKVVGVPAKIIKLNRD